MKHALLRILRLTLLSCAVAVAASLASAQERATLVADQVSVVGDNVVRAEGNVEVLYQGRRLTARAVIYDANTDTLTVEGPLRLVEGDAYVVLASSAELDEGFRNGMIASARLVLEQSFQITGTELTRVGGRYTQLTRSVASTCTVCTPGQAPLWQIRAQRIVHDAELRQLYFDNAFFEVAGVPVFYLPRLRMPDPTVDRARGFLIPGIRSSNRLDTGLQFPYFIPISDSADLTLVPYVSPRTTTLGFRYRELYKSGAINLNGAFSQDDVRDDEDLRGYLFGRGIFFLPDRYKLDFNIEYASDDNYLSDYGISGQDRIISDFFLSRVTRNRFFRGGATRYRSYRNDEDNDTIPRNIGNVLYQERFRLGPNAGIAEARFQLYGFNRESDVDVIGRDYSRVSGSVDWSNTAVFGPGLELGGRLRVSSDYYMIGGDSTTDNDGRITGDSAVSLRWPLEKTAADGSRHLLEPAIQVAWTETTDTDIPDEESTLVSFDEGNLFGFNRIPGRARYEEGLRANIGLAWTRFDPTGWNMRLGVGRVYRADDLGQFNEATGLDGRQSDWLVSASLKTAGGFFLANRALVDDDVSFTMNEASLSYSWDRLRLQGDYLWLVAEPEVGRDQDSNELDLRGDYRISDNWMASFRGRYDFVADRAARAGLGLVYTNECVEVDLSFRRSFTSSDDVTAITRFDVAVTIPQGSSAEKRRRKCYG
ncbi:MAG: LPS assembly protein LptD [Pseudomonadota bacterium]